MSLSQDSQVDSVRHECVVKQWVHRWYRKKWTTRVLCVDLQTQTLAVKKVKIQEVNRSVEIVREREKEKEIDDPFNTMALSSPKFVREHLPYVLSDAMIAIPLYIEDPHALELTVDSEILVFRFSDEGTRRSWIRLFLICGCFGLGPIKNFRFATAAVDVKLIKRDDSDSQSDADPESGKKREENQPAHDGEFNKHLTADEHEMNSSPSNEPIELNNVAPPQKYFIRFVDSHYSKQGYLQKRGIFNPALATRYFRTMLNAAGHRVLAYFTSPYHPSPRAVILLEGARIDDIDPNLNDFCITTLRRMYVLCASSLIEKRSWIQVLTQLSDRKLDRWSAIFEENVKPVIILESIDSDFNDDDDFLPAVDFYSILSLSPNCSQENISSAYEKTTLVLNQAEVMKDANILKQQRMAAKHAFEILNHPIRRVQYDQLSSGYFNLATNIPDK